MKSNKLTILLVAILIAITAYFVYTRTAGTIRKELRDFAVKDIEAVTKIFLADKKGNQTTLEKQPNGKWIINGKYPAQQDAVVILLQTIKQVEVRSPVGKAAYNNVIKELGTDGNKIEIFAGDDLIKTYYVGQPTQDMLGTFMFLENSSVPFVTHIPGFDGFLSTRYTAKTDDWRSKLIFNYSEAEIKNITITDPKDTAQSFRLEKTGEDFSLFIPASNTQPTEVFKSKIIAYLNRFLRLGYEWEEFKIAQNVKDSMLATTPYKTLQLINTQGKTDKITFYRKPTRAGTLTSNDQETGKLRPFDGDRMFALWNSDTNFYAIQYFGWDPVFKSPDQIKGFGE